MRVVRGILVLACNLLVLMPMGWCCWLMPAAPAKAGPASVASCPSCCGHQAKQRSGPAKPQDSPRPIPCDCVQPAADLMLPDDTIAPLPMLAVLFEVEPVNVAQAAWPLPILRTDKPPSLQVLHCVWLC